MTGILLLKRFLLNRFLRSHFSKEEHGQDLIEYTLLIAFVAITSAAIFIQAGSGVNHIGSNSNSMLSDAIGVTAR